MGLLGDGNVRPLCDFEEDRDEHHFSCERYAVCIVDGDGYCEIHASAAPTSDR